MKTHTYLSLIGSIKLCPTWTINKCNFIILQLYGWVHTFFNFKVYKICQRLVTLLLLTLYIGIYLYFVVRKTMIMQPSTRR